MTKLDDKKFLNATGKLWSIFDVINLLNTPLNTKNRYKRFSHNRRKTHQFLVWNSHYLRNIKHQCNATGRKYNKHDVNLINHLFPLSKKNVQLLLTSNKIRKSYALAINLLHERLSAQKILHKNGLTLKQYKAVNMKTHQLFKQAE